MTQGVRPLSGAIRAVAGRRRTQTPPSRSAARVTTMPEERLWAPWRLDYIKGPKPDECIFCAGPSASEDPVKYIVKRGDHCFAMLNAYPYNNGHPLISPYR